MGLGHLARIQEEWNVGVERERGRDRTRKIVATGSGQREKVRREWTLSEELHPEVRTVGLEFCSLDVEAFLPRAGSIHGWANELSVERDSPRCERKSGCSSVSQDHAQTVKNLSSCSSRACWPKVSKIEAKDPCLI